MKSELDAIQFDTSQWRFHSSETTVRWWLNDAFADQLSLHYFPIRPNIPVPITEVSALRDFFRGEVIRSGSGLVAVDTVNVNGVQGVRVIVKDRQQPHGMTYVGSITIPFANFSYVLKVQCLEHGVTGIREAIVMDEWLKAHSGDPPETIMAGFSQDPYDPGRRDTLMRNAAEDELRDSQFPQHPLSRTRRYLADLELTIEFNPSVRGASRFDPAI